MDDGFLVRQVLGGNRDDARDFRHFGVLPLAHVTALARQVWFSAGRDEGVRLRRVGKLLDRSSSRGADHRAGRDGRHAGRRRHLHLRIGSTTSARRPAVKV
jgi:hypothetical protein